jgi:hypothetical protein
MKNRIVYSILTGLICLVVILNLPIHAAEDKSLSSIPALAKMYQFPAKVRVTVSGDENIMKSVTSFISRELRSLSDVELVENHPEWIIDIIVFEFKVGSKPCVASSAIIYSRSDLQAGGNPDHRLSLCPLNELEKDCKEIVVIFDTKHLEKSRKFLRGMKEKLEKSK